MANGGISRLHSTLSMQINGFLILKPRQKVSKLLLLVLLEFSSENKPLLYVCVFFASVAMSSLSQSLSPFYSDLNSIGQFIKLPPVSSQNRCTNFGSFLLFFVSNWNHWCKQNIDEKMFSFAFGISFFIWLFHTKKNRDCCHIIHEISQIK